MKFSVLLYNSDCVVRTGQSRKISKNELRTICPPTQTFSDFLDECENDNVKVLRLRQIEIAVTKDDWLAHESLTHPKTVVEIERNALYYYAKMKKSDKPAMDAYTCQFRPVLDEEKIYADMRKNRFDFSFLQKAVNLTPCST